MGNEINWAEEILNETPDVVNNIPTDGPVMKADESALGTNVQTDLNTDTHAGKIDNMYPTIHENNYIDSCFYGFNHIIKLFKNI